jgi:hypothetical protein
LYPIEDVPICRISQLDVSGKFIGWSFEVLLKALFVVLDGHLRSYLGLKFLVGAFREPLPFLN